METLFENIWPKLAAAMIAAFGAIMGWFDSLDPMLQLLAFLMVADVVSGVLASIASRTPLSSDISGPGMARKMMMLLGVVVAGMLEPHSGGVPIGKMTASFLCLHEGLSLLENWNRAGLPKIPGIRDVLENLGGRSGGGPAAVS